MDYARIRVRLAHTHNASGIPPLAKKQVDANDGHYIRSGSIKLGTAAGYADLENGRADYLDSGTEIRMNALSHSSKADRDAYRRVTGGELRGYAGNNQFTFSSAPAWIFCMSIPECKHDPSPEIPKLHFLVNPQKLASAILLKYADIMEHYMIGIVAYEGRVNDALDEKYYEPDYFIKRPIFRSEQEIRIVWLPRAGVSVEEIITGKDEHLARLFRPEP